MGNFDESEVMDAAICRQALSLLVDALGDFEGMDDPPQGFSPKLDLLRVALRMGRAALKRPRVRSCSDGSQPVSAADDDDFPDYEDDDDEDRTCPACGGDGGDPMNDYVLPCEYCVGEGRIR